MRALVVEDESRIAEFLARGLAAEGFVVEVAADGVSALRWLRASEFDVVVLDLRLPGLPGEEVLRRIRAAGSDVPVIVLTAKDAVADRVANLDAGADDYLVKPFSFTELVARIRRRLRTAARTGTDATRLHHGDLVLDLRLRVARHGGSAVELSAREFALLEALIRHGGAVLSQQQLLDLVWGYGHDPGSNVVEVTVRRLRRKLAPDLIETVRGAGYRLARCP